MAAESPAPIERIIKAAVDRGASDLHIKAGDLFRARIDGVLVPLTKQRLTPAQTRAIAARLLPTDDDRARLDGIHDFDCSWGLPGVGRFRVSVLRQRSSFMIVMRVIPFAVPTLEGLELPASLGSLAATPAGLVLVAGVSGSGKSSTIAAMLHHLNQTTEQHIITVEDPIEYLHRDIKCSVTQREVGIDTASLTAGLRAALRQDADVIVVGDIHDPEGLDTAIKAAETGTLVIGAVHAPDAVTSVGQVLALMPAGERTIGRLRFAEALTAIVAQQLLPRKGGSGRIAAVEILTATPEIRAVLRAPDRLAEIGPLMAKAPARSGMQTFDQHIAQLARAGAISQETAKAASLTPDAGGKAARR